MYSRRAHRRVGKHLLWGLARPRVLGTLRRRVARPLTGAPVALTESYAAVSGSGARGVFQVMHMAWNGSDKSAQR